MDGIDITDLEDNNYRPIKSFIIPLWNLPDKNFSSLIFLKNRFLGFDRAFQKGEDTEKIYHVQKQKNVYDYNDITWYDYDLTELDKNTTLDEKIYNNYLFHQKREIFDEMHYESLIKYIPGSIIVFDTFQLHVSSNIIKSNVSLKSGIRLTLWRDKNEE